MTTKEFVEKYKKVYTSLINDPDTKETENRTREEVASEEAKQRVKQSINNEKALSMAAELSSVEKFTNFVTKEDINLDDLIYGTPSRSHLITMKKPVTLFDIDTKRINVKEPPSNSSKETKKELRSLQDQTKNVDKELKERINREDKNLEITFYEYLDKNNLDYDKNFIQSIIQETRIYVQHFKYKFNRPRPRQLGDLVGIPVIQQEGEASNTPAYPSGHTIQARLIALFLGREHPEHREELLKIAEEIGINRIKGGFHYTSDHEAGRLIANDLWASLLKKVRRMKKSFGSDPVSELVKDYIEYRKDKWSNVTKIGNFVTEQSLQKAKGDEDDEEEGPTEEELKAIEGEENNIDEDLTNLEDNIETFDTEADAFMDSQRAIQEAEEKLEGLKEGKPSYGKGISNFIRGTEWKGIKFKTEASLKAGIGDIDTWVKSSHEEKLVIARAFEKEHNDSKKSEGEWIEERKNLQQDQKIYRKEKEKNHNDFVNKQTTNINNIKNEIKSINTELKRIEEKYPDNEDLKQSMNKDKQKLQRESTKLKKTIETSNENRTEFLKNIGKEEKEELDKFDRNKKFTNETHDRISKQWKKTIQDAIDNEKKGDPAPWAVDKKWREHRNSIAASLKSRGAPKEEIPAGKKPVRDAAVALYEKITPNREEAEKRYNQDANEGKFDGVDKKGQVEAKFLEHHAEEFLEKNPDDFANYNAVMTPDAFKQLTDTEDGGLEIETISKLFKDGVFDGDKKFTPAKVKKVKEYFEKLGNDKALKFAKELINEERATTGQKSTHSKILEHLMENDEYPDDDFFKGDENSVEDNIEEVSRNAAEKTYDKKVKQNIDNKDYMLKIGGMHKWVNENELTEEQKKSLKMEESTSLVDTKTGKIVTGDDLTKIHSKKTKKTTKKEPKAEKPKTEKPKTEEPKAKETKTEEPKAETTEEEKRRILEEWEKEEGGRKTVQTEEEKRADPPKRPEIVIDEGDEGPKGEPKGIEGPKGEPTEEPKAEAEAEEPKAEEETGDSGRTQLPLPEGESKTEEPVAEEEEEVEEPKADPIQEAIDGLGPRVQELYENLVDEDDREAYSLEDWIDHELKTKKTAAAVRAHVVKENKKHRKIKTAEEEKKNTGETVRAEQETKAEEEEIKRRTDQETNLSARAKELGYTDEDLETAFKDDDLTAFEEQIKSEEAVTTDRLFQSIDENHLPSNFPFGPDKEPETPKMIRDLKDKLKNFIEEVLKTSETKALEAAYSKHVQTILESSHRTDPKNPHLYNEKLHTKLKEMDEAINQLSKYSVKDDGTPILTEERKKEIAKKLIKEYKEAKDKKDLRNRFDSIDNEMHEGIDKPTKEEKLELLESDEKLAGQRRENEETGNPEIYVPGYDTETGKKEGWTEIGEKVKGKFGVSGFKIDDEKLAQAQQKIDEWEKNKGIKQLPLPEDELGEDEKPKPEDEKPKPEEPKKPTQEKLPGFDGEEKTKEEFAEEIGVDPKDLKLTPAGDVIITRGSQAKIKTKVKEIAEKLGIKRENIQTTPEGEVKITPEEKVETAEAKLRAENMKAGEPGTGAEGQQQRYVPGKGKGFKDIWSKKDGVWGFDAAKSAAVEAEIQEWRKANNLEAPKRLPKKFGGGRVGGEIKINGKDPTKKPKSAVESFSDRFKGAKEKAGSAVSSLSSFIDTMRGKKD